MKAPRGWKSHANAGRRMCSVGWGPIRIWTVGRILRENFKMKRSTRDGLRLLTSGMVAVVLTSCVTTQKYNSMLQQQKALETSLQSEVNADQVKIEQLEDGIRVRMSGELLYRSGSVNLSPSGEKTLSKVAAQLTTIA